MTNHGERASTGGPSTVIDVRDTEAPTPFVRAAGIGDIDAVLRLRQLMLDAMGEPSGSGPWLDTVAEDLRERLPDDLDLRVYVVDVEGEVAACAVGLIHRTLASPRRPDGAQGYLFNVATDPAHRGKGYATAVVTALVDWFRERGVERIDLDSTPEAALIYERLGFTRRHRAYTLHF
jgi:GNAT superfamily N-acetyltransferase